MRDAPPTSGLSVETVNGAARRYVSEKSPIGHLLSQVCRHSYFDVSVLERRSFADSLKTESHCLGQPKEAAARCVCQAPTTDEGHYGIRACLASGGDRAESQAGESRYAGSLSGRAGGTAYGLPSGDAALPTLLAKGGCPPCLSFLIVSVSVHSANEKEIAGSEAVSQEAGRVLRDVEEGQR